MSDVLHSSRPTVDELVQAVADAIAHATDKGMDLNEALSMVAVVATDMGRLEFGDGYVDTLAGTVKLRLASR